MNHCTIKEGKCVTCGRTVTNFDPEKVYIVKCKVIVPPIPGPIQPKPLSPQLKRKLEYFKGGTTHQCTIQERNAKLQICSTCQHFSGMRCRVNLCMDRFVENLVFKKGQCFDTPPKWGENEVQSMQRTD